jgi:hypothetical protein
MNAAFLAEKTGHPAQAERWADAVDRWQHQDPSPRAASGSTRLSGPSWARSWPRSPGRPTSL